MPAAYRAVDADIGFPRPVPSVVEGLSALVAASLGRHGTASCTLGRAIRRDEARIARACRSTAFIRFG
jgi:hypothetical protein